jgi:predicted membrane-bound dolichyl-phosphate-mannose-protein mannosyltransferase
VRTKYSNIYDLKNKTVYIFYKQDFTRYASFNLGNQLKKLKPGEKSDYNIQKLQFQKVTEEISNSVVAETGTQKTDVSPSPVAEAGTHETVASASAVTAGPKDSNTIIKNKSWLWLYALIIIMAAVIYFISSKRRSFHNK